MSRTRVGVIRGGPSEEFDISLKTGANVLEAIDTNVFEPFDIVVSKSGEWLLNGRSRYPEHIIPTFDVFFIALHGTYGEDGTVQRLLDRYNIPYTGSKAYASKIAMHKILAKEYVAPLGIKVPRHLRISSEDIDRIHTHVSTIRSLFGPEYFIKPVSSGSSKGIQLVTNHLMLQKQIESALNDYDEILVEERIHGREVTCGVIERFRGEDLYALPPVEIIPPVESPFFDYDAKYSGLTREICPAQLTFEEKCEIESASKDIHSGLHLSQYSRSDFILANGELYFLEVNTLPGLTKESLLPKSIEAVGASHTEFVTHLLNDAQNLIYA